MKCDNVKIPIDLLNNVINVLENVYYCKAVLHFSTDFMEYFELTLWRLRQKAQSLELRAAYSNMVSAKSDDERLVARIIYLQLKNAIDSYKCDPPS